MVIVIAQYIPFNREIISIVPLKKSYYGEGSGSIILDDCECRGDENNLLECPRRLDTSVFTTNCDHTEDAGVKCNGIQ